MTHHLNLLSSAPLAPARAPGLPAALLPGLALAMVAAAGGLAAFNHHRLSTLAEQVRQADAAAGAPATATSAAPNRRVLDVLAQRTADREALAAMLQGEPVAEAGVAAIAPTASGPVAGDAQASGAEARASAWLQALDQTARAGVALNQVHIEPGARLSLTGSALSPQDINGLIERLQLHPLTGRAALGQLEIRRGAATAGAGLGGGAATAGDGAGLRFSITPPVIGAGGAGAQPSGGRPGKADRASP